MIKSGNERKIWLKNSGNLSLKNQYHQGVISDLITTVIQISNEKIFLN
jgi:hypothetical protein